MNAFSTTDWIISMAVFAVIGVSLWWWIRSIRKKHELPLYEAFKTIQEQLDPNNKE
jgi:hypothetical protein